MSNEIMKKTSFEIPEDMLKGLKHEATDLGISMKELYYKIIKEYLSKNSHYKEKKDDKNDKRD
ncbi:MAG: hypothetical protein HPY53_01350 [Brevinematales bacterium]|nr:hypothetical protein [Brevinematales bacterium]